MINFRLVENSNFDASHSPVCFRRVVPSRVSIVFETGPGYDFFFSPLGRTTIPTAAIALRPYTIVTMTARFEVIARRKIRFRGRTAFVRNISLRRPGRVVRPARPRYE